LALIALQIFALAEIGAEGDDFRLIGFLQPLENDRRIEPPGIGQHHFLNGF
jgi:uncharacterized protein (DUF39 family)